MSNPRATGLAFLLIGVLTLVGNTLDVLPAEALEILRCVNDSRFAPPLDEDELEAVLLSIGKAELKRRGIAA